MRHSLLAALAEDVVPLFGRFLLANLSATIALPRDWTMTARLENMFDEQYELARGYNTMDRSLFVSLRHEFR